MINTNNHKFWHFKFSKLSVIDEEDSGLSTWISPRSRGIFLWVEFGFTDSQLGVERAEFGRLTTPKSDGTRRGVLTLGRGEHVCPPIRAVPVEGRLFGSLFIIDELEASKRRAAGESSDRDGLQNKWNLKSFKKSEY